MGPEYQSQSNEDYIHAFVCCVGDFIYLLITKWHLNILKIIFFICKFNGILVQKKLGGVFLRVNLRKVDLRKVNIFV